MTEYEFKKVLESIIDVIASQSIIAVSEKI
nr:MAG TPA: hypothetical protein [Caudoviricetes sp.]